MEEVIVWIRKRRKKGMTWENLMLAGETSEEGLRQFLNHQEKYNDWPYVSVDEWSELVKEQKRKELEIDALIDAHGASVIADVNEQNDLTLPEGEDSAWQTYRRLLINERGFAESTVEMIEGATFKILKNLSRNTVESGAVKGLVVGNVQSGKTANMVALMAMAADRGWNMFVILSGMMNNLKDQTIRRIMSDLNGSKWDWKPIWNPRARLPYGENVNELDLTDGSRKRYLSVCIKNATRLTQLLDWINYDQEKKQNIRLLIIDDEADQASINASTDDRTEINRLLLDLVNNRKNHNVIGSKAEAINYVGYTATPYANVLNEPPGEESLYPKNFITTLYVSDEYFGPQQIFGYYGDDAEDNPVYPGMDIVRNISDPEVNDIDEIHAGNSDAIPDSLTTSIAWFLCGVAAMRLREYKKPVSMLVHTSRNTDHHENIKRAIVNWFETTSKSLKLEICRKVWEEETRRFTEKELREAYPSYGNSTGVNSITPNPSFDEILPVLDQLLDEQLKNILINSDDKRRSYSNGVHLCVDNSSKQEDDAIQMRLMYPEENEMPGFAPAFLVIGGNTLSRGLTLEGLISTFFLRPAKCADTLMQMGRWFGYRRGYELLPRIWMPQTIKDQFVFIAEMDQRLRDEIRQMERIGVSPTDCGPKILASPSTKFLRIVSSNKSQSEVGAEYDFAGHTKETGVFNNSVEELEANLELTKQFLLSLGLPADTTNNPYATSNTVWRNVKWTSIKEDFLTRYKFCERLKDFNEMKPFFDWFDTMSESGQYGDWNVILAGVRNSGEENRWIVSDKISTNKVKRTQITPDRADGTMNIKVLRSFNDFLSDVEVDGPDSQLLARMANVKHTLSALNLLRERIGLGATPQLVIYVINKDSAPDNNSKTRYPLNAKRDVAGFSINIPGYRKNRSTVTSITINISREDQFND